MWIINLIRHFAFFGRFYEIPRCSIITNAVELNSHKLSRFEMSARNSCFGCLVVTKIRIFGHKKKAGGY